MDLLVLQDRVDGLPPHQVRYVGEGQRLDERAQPMRVERRLFLRRFAGRGDRRGTLQPAMRVVAQHAHHVEQHVVMALEIVPAAESVDDAGIDLLGQRVVVEQIAQPASRLLGLERF